jgi:hypothetical protein
MDATFASDRRAGRRVWIDAADGAVLALYRNGFLQSLIFHVALLLMMALAVIAPARPAAAVRLAVDFAPAADAAVDLQDALVLEPAVAQATPALLAADPPLPAHAWDNPDAQPLPALEPAAAEVAALDSGVQLAGFDVTEMLAELPAVTTLAGLPAAAAGSAATSGGRGGDRGFGDGGRGFGGELGRRLAMAGARTGDVQISIAWDNFNDIDVHVMVESVAPRRGISMINFSNRRGACGGWLDVDQNVVPMTPAAVENVFWARGAAPFGRYTVYVHQFRNWGGENPTEVQVAVLVDGKQSHHTATVHAGSGPVVVTSFVRERHHAAAAPTDDFDDSSAVTSSP